MRFREENSNAFEEEKLRASAVDGVENILDGIVAQMRDVVSGALVNKRKKDAYARHRYLVSQIFPQFDHTLGQLSELAPKTAIRCLQIYASQLKGPAQRPTKNPYKLLEGVLTHLEESRAAVEKKAHQADVGSLPKSRPPAGAGAAAAATAASSRPHALSL